MKNSITGTILGYIVILILISGMICLFFLIRKILKKYISSGEIRKEKSVVKKH